MYTWTLSTEQIEKAAEWWANAVQKPRFDNGDSSSTGGMATMLALLLASENEPNVDAISKFKTALSQALTSPEFHPGWGLDVDYHPDKTLADAAQLAGISDSLFPWKTHMRFEQDGTVRVKCGYGADYITI